MHHQATTLKPPTPFPHHYHPSPPSPSRLLLPISHPLQPNTRPCSPLSCRGIHIPALKHPPHSLASSNTVLQDRNPAAVKTIDVATLGNLCVDIVLDVPELPPPSREARKAYMEQLSASPPDKKYWEAGGNCNVAIAAARLGLNCVVIGHVGNEIYGKFLQDVLRDEGIGVVEMSEETDFTTGSSGSYETLLCWVLVDPLHRHGFCSRFDFSEGPAFSWMSKLSDQVKKAIKQSRIIFCNGYDFDEFSPNVLVSSVEYAVEVGTSVFFDPGPRGKSLLTGTPQEQKALSHLLRMSDVLLLTSDEAASLTGIGNPTLAGQELLRRGVRTKWVIVKMGPKGSLLITTSSVTCAPAFQVKVIDTVGCGDSFVAAVAFGFIHDIPLISTLAIANAVGAATAMGSGAGRNVATLKQVIELIKAPNLNEDDEFWNKLLSEHFNIQEITFLKKVVINGSNNRMNLIALQRVVSDLLPKLESVQLEGNVSS
ncbi:hypothetical protein SLEP1_g30365 [Rubroshorea leprosula]|uniref:Carbohydrate kinase PfkB domain-containing protein n=1 Tax=Rubroshorea leprosula TaxID=152421 RepID=A0AAV5K7K2_9ROSI|nr:hypothetical protein SLEP1_g30365 [Rubroshorea leprosula]